MQSVKTEIIDRILKEIGSSMTNRCGSIIINELKRELLLLKEPLLVPSIHVSGLDYPELSGVAEKLAGIMPEYLAGHTLLANQKPPVECHTMQFVKLLHGRFTDYIHMFKIDLRFSSGTGTQKGAGDSDHFPPFEAEGLVVGSHIIPVTEVKYADGAILDFAPLRIIGKESVEGSDSKIMVHTFFDDFDPTEINEKIWGSLDSSIFPFSPKIYPFVSYSYFSACLNLPDPVASALDKSVRFYEAMLVKLLFVFGRLEGEVSDRIDQEYISFRDGVPYFTEKFTKEGTEFFSRYSVYQNDEFMMKRWRRLDVKD
jgi:hypothetical protein